MGPHRSIIRWDWIWQETIMKSRQATILFRSYKIAHACTPPWTIYGWLVLPRSLELGGRRLKFCSPVSPLSSLSAHWTRMCVPRDFTIFPGSQVVIFDATPKSLQLCNSFFSSMTIFVVRTNRDPRGEDEVTSPKTRTRLCADLKLPHGTSTIDDFHSGFVVHARDAIESYLRVDRSSRRLIWVIVTCEETLVCFQFPMGGPSTMSTQRLGPVTMICRVRDKPKKFTD